MFRFSGEVVIDRPAVDIGSFLADFDRYPEWTDMGRTRRLTEGPVGPGTRAEGMMGSGPMRVAMTWEITRYDPGRILAYRTVSKGVLGMDGSYLLEPITPASTRVKAEGTVRTRGLLRLLEPLIKGEIRRGESRELERMKAILEAEPAEATVAAPG
jgi:hypothetical protein